MSCNWNAIIVPFDEKRQIAAKKLYTKRGSHITLLSATVLVKSIIIELKKPISKPMVLVSNLLTHYDVEGANVIHEYSPIYVFSISESHTTKVVQVEDPISINFCEKDEISFQLMTIDKKKINLSFSVHFYYKLN